LKNGAVFKKELAPTKLNLIIPAVDDPDVCCSLASAYIPCFSSDTLEQNVLDGHLAVEHLEHKLVDRLLELRSQEPVIGPSFERLQVT